MDEPYVEHPAEEALERYLLHQARQEELESVEAHVLACESCVTRLENLESDIAALKLALAQLEEEQTVRAPTSAHSGWRRWFTLPTLSWAGAVAAIALAITVVPRVAERNRSAAEYSLSAYRGMESIVVPEGRPLHLTLNADGLPAAAAGVTLVDENGAQVWSGNSEIRDGRISVTIPRIAESGPHFVRLYSQTAGSQPRLLREYAIDVQ